MRTRPRRADANAADDAICPEKRHGRNQGRNQNPGAGDKTADKDGGGSRGIGQNHATQLAAKTAAGPEALGLSQGP